MTGYVCSDFETWRSITTIVILGGSIGLWLQTLRILLNLGHIFTWYSSIISSYQIITWHIFCKINCIWVVKIMVKFSFAGLNRLLQFMGTCKKLKKVNDVIEWWRHQSLVIEICTPLWLKLKCNLFLLFLCLLLDTKPSNIVKRNHVQ